MFLRALRNSASYRADYPAGVHKGAMVSNYGNAHLVAHRPVLNVLRLKLFESQTSQNLARMGAKNAKFSQFLKRASRPLTTSAASLQGEKGVN